MLAKIDAVESPHVPNEAVARQVEKIVHSKAFHSSEILRHLLEYLSGCSLEGRQEALKVKEIARAVFGRSENFDSQSDSVVRVHTGRLRSKLAEYYIDEGAEDELIISIPKGAYGLAWHPRASAPVPVAAAPAIEALPVPPKIVETKPSRVAWRYWLGVVAVAILSSILTWLGLHSHLDSSSKLEERSHPALATFWKPFLSKGDPPLVVFSNFRLVGSLDESVRPYDEARDKGNPNLIDTYTTTGEVMGVFDVTRNLASFQQTAQAKHGQLLTWDDARERNLIFVGGPLAHTPLRTLSALQELQFRHGGGGAIVNVHPRPGEQQVYEGPTTRPFQYDYAIVAARPGLTQNRRILILAGVNEYGTQGAAEFVTREDQVSGLLSRLGVKLGDSIPSFEALLRVKVEGEVPLQYEILIARRTH
jgi:hypothetical protein